MTSHVLREYAFLGDGWRGALVGPRGDMVWMCLPRWDDEAVFSALLGGSGRYVVAPEGVDYVWGGSYEPGSLIWRSRWVTTDGVVESRDALAYPGESDRAVVLRRLECLSGRARVRVELCPVAGFDDTPMTGVSKRGEVWTAQLKGTALRWSGAATARRREGRLLMHLDLQAGQSHDLVLELGEPASPGDQRSASQAWEETEQAWERAVPSFAATVAPRDAQHSYAVLRGLTVPGGGMVAAATTSLPERAEAGENYDYRYAWIRDQCFAGQAVAVHGGLPLVDDAVAFVSARLLEHGPDLRPAYTVTGGTVPQERRLELPGYPGGGAKVGNWVREQFQLDAFGEALLLFARASEVDRLDLDHWRAVETAVAAVRDHWSEAGAGIWELEDDHWTHSRLICAAGLRAVAGHAPGPQAADWSALADKIVADTSAEGLHHDGYWQRSSSDQRVDASLLLPGLRGAVAGDDPRTLATVDAVSDALAEDFFLYRYRHDDRPLHEAEGAFLVSGFHMALALAQQGRDVEAMRWFERARTACGPPGIFTEEFDVVQRQLRGNVPQGFVHALLLECAGRLMSATGSSGTSPSRG